MVKKKIKTFDIVAGGMLIALFFMASNIIPVFYPIANIPVTLQVLVVTLMGGLLGVRAGMLNFFTLLLATFIGLPFMSGFKGGPAVFFGPTAGFIIGWVFIVLLAGICHDVIAPRMKSSVKNKTLYSVGFIVLTVIGVLLCYAAGSLWMVVYNRAGLAALWPTAAANLVFLPFDALKCFVACAICCCYEFVPGFLRNLKTQH